MAGGQNVFLLSADSLRADAFADRMDALGAATGGTRFRNAVAPASHTASAVPGLATGEFADATGDKAKDAGSLLREFRDAGYETVVVTDNPLLEASIAEGGASSDSRLARLDEALPRRATRTLERAYFRFVRPAGRRAGILGPYYRPATTLNRIAREQVSEAGRPVFCWIHYMDTHSPYWPPGWETADGNPHGGRRADGNGDGPGHPEGDARRTHAYGTAARSRSVALGGAGSGADDLEPIRRLYRRTCEDLGDVLEEFLWRLRGDGVFDPAEDVLVVTADHGECLDPDRDVIGHVPAASWESMVHVPLLVARPDWPETTIGGQVSLVDLPQMLRGGLTVARGSGDVGGPSSFVREYAFTVARTLGASQFVRGVRSADGRKLFGRRTSSGVDVLRTTFEAGDPDAERVVERREPDAEPTDPGALEPLLARRGGPTGPATDHRQFDESQLRSLGYLE